MDTAYNVNLNKTQLKALTVKLTKELENCRGEISNMKFDNKSKSDQYKDALINIFNDALNSTNMGDYTCKGLMHLMSNKIVEIEGEIKRSDLRKMFN
jgi:hypothetical protein